MSGYHVPVMLDRCVEALSIDPSGIYVDATFGGGGHSREILGKLQNGMLYAFDQDADAKANADSESFRNGKESSFTFIDSNFRYLKRQLRFHGASQVDGILADLGVSSHQLDEGGRGFSTRFDGGLDMRMDQRAAGATAMKVVNGYGQEDLVRVLGGYGEIKNARTLAAAIAGRRRQGPITGNGQLKEIAWKVAPRGREMKYLAQLFQAIRIEVNDEMGALNDFLGQAADVLRPGGRLAVISYHSLEDRPVKNYMKTGNLTGKVKQDFYGNVIRPFKPLTKKPIVAEEEEINKNSRARSAKLRVGERLEGQQ